MPAEKDDMQGPILRGEVKTIRALLDAGHPIEQPVMEDYTPLYYAAERGKTPIVKLLIERGANLNLQTRQFQYSPLMVAARNEKLDIVKALLAAGADQKLADKHGRTALHFAARGETKAAPLIVEELLRAGADVRSDPAVLVKVAGSGVAESIKLLVDAGADVNAVYVGRTPLVAAVHEWHLEQVAILLECGADPQVRYLKKNLLEYAQSRPASTAAPGVRKKMFKLLEDTLAGKKIAATAAPTVSATDIPALWMRIEKALEVSAPTIRAALGPGADTQQFHELETLCKVTLPEEFQAAWRIHDGQGVNVGSLIPEGFTDDEYELLSIKGMLAEWTPWKELIDGGEFAGNESVSDTGIRADWWHPAWIPFASNGGGDSLCIDLAPTDQGTLGQVISMSHETAERKRLAASIAVFLALLAEKLEDAE